MEYQIFKFLTFENLNIYSVALYKTVDLEYKIAVASSKIKRFFCSFGMLVLVYTIHDPIEAWGFYWSGYGMYVLTMYNGQVIPLLMK